MTCKEERGVSDSANRDTVSQCIPIWCKLHLLEVYQVLCGKSSEGRETYSKGVTDEL